MTTTGERLVTLSGLLTVETAMVHYLAIETGSGPGGIAYINEIEVEVEPEDVLTATLGEGLTAVIEEPIDVEIEDEEIDVEVDNDGITGEVC